MFLSERVSWHRCVCGLITAMTVAGCARFEESGLPGSAASMARNQLMVVTRSPESFGCYRLSSLSETYPDFGFFVRRRGLPDFLAETSNEGKSYYILYYLRDRQAYASRLRPGTRRSLEFAGPYPITDREVEVLAELKDKQPGSSGVSWRGMTRSRPSRDPAEVVFGSQ